MLLIVLPVSLVLRAILPDMDPEPISLVVLPPPYVVLAAGLHEPPVVIDLPLNPLTLENPAILENNSAVPMSVPLHA